MGGKNSLYRRGKKLYIEGKKSSEMKTLSWEVINRTSQKGVKTSIEGEKTGKLDQLEQYFL